MINAMPEPADIPCAIKPETTRGAIYELKLVPPPDQSTHNDR